MSLAAALHVGETGLNGPGTITLLQFQPGLVPGLSQHDARRRDRGSKTYTDLTFSYDHELSNGKSWQLALAITNALDEDPPIDPDVRPAFQLADESARTRTTFTAGATC